MPIKGITDRGERFPEIGQIRKGAAKVDGKIGKDLNYFRVTFDDAEQKSAQKFLQLYGPEPQAIKVMFCFNEIYRHWDANLEAYTAGRMIARSDGETYQFLFDTRTNKVVVNKGIPEKKYIEGEVLGTWHNNKKNTEEPIYCKYVGRLRLVIPELGRLNYLTAITYSRHDIENLSSQINALSIINHGIISGIPLILKRVPRMISCPNNDGTMARRLKWLLSLEADPEWVGPKFANMKALIFPEKTAGYLGTGEIIESNSPTAQEIETLPVNTTDDEDDEKSKKDTGRITE